MNFNPDFDKQQLDQLAGQYLQGSTVKGKMTFFTDEENRLSHATWRFADEDQDALRELGFKFALMDLLDNLVTYRVRGGQPNAGQGVVSIDGSTIRIQWIPLEAAEEMREQE